MATATDADWSIRAQRLSKSYKVYEKPSDLLAEIVTGGQRHRVHDAVSDVSFTLAPGEVVGIIGSNGAGKSTLLKMIAGTLTPTSGQLDVRGKISAILELGTGFHPEYSGRENVYLGGMCLGMSRAQVESKFDWIVDFAELGHVIDRPFKTYSSGMQARLTFATAISIEPEILIIDEALAAGDAYFVVKCGQRVRELCASGATVLFVSHSTYQVASLCQRAIWIEGGKVREIGDAIEVCRHYDYAVHERLSNGDGEVVTISPDFDAIEDMAPVGDTANAEANAPLEAASLAEVTDAAAGPGAADARIDDVTTLPGEAVEQSAALAEKAAPQAPGDAKESYAFVPAQPGLVSAKAGSKLEIVGLSSVHDEIFRRGPTRITAIRWLTQDGKPASIVRSWDPVTLVVEYACAGSEIPQGTLGLSLAINRKHDRMLVAMFSTVNPVRDDDLAHYDAAPFRKPAMEKGKLVARFEHLELMEGEYLLSLGLQENIPSTSDFHEYHHMRYRFRISRNGYPSGAVFQPSIEWAHEPL